MIDWNEIMKEEIARYVELVNCSTGEEKQAYKDCVRDLMMAINKKDWKLYDECQKIIDENYEREETFSR